jgi:hypothetical protein
MLNYLKWYKENRALKRQSAVMLQKYIQMSPNGFTEDLSTIDENESDKQVDEELAALRKASKGKIRSQFLASKF